MRHCLCRDWISSCRETRYQIKGSVCKSGAEVSKGKEGKKNKTSLLHFVWCFLPMSSSNLQSNCELCLFWPLFPFTHQSIKYDVHTCRDHTTIRHLKYSPAKSDSFLAPPTGRALLHIHPIQNTQKSSKKPKQSSSIISPQADSSAVNTLEQLSQEIWHHWVAWQSTTTPPRQPPSLPSRFTALYLSLSRRSHTWVRCSLRFNLFICHSLE